MLLAYSDPRIDNCPNSEIASLPCAWSEAHATILSTLRPQSKATRGNIDIVINLSSWTFSEQGQSAPQLICNDANARFSGEVLQSALVTMVMLAQGLPVGAPARQKLRDVHQAILKALDNPGLLLMAATRTEFGSGQGAALLNLAQSTFGKLKSQGSYFFADTGLVGTALLHRRVPR